MVLAVLRNMLLAVTLLAFFGGMTLQAMPPVSAAVGSGTAKMADNCPHMSPLQHQGGSTRSMPCKSMDPECVKQMGCLGIASLPLRQAALEGPFAYGKAAYWTPVLNRAGRSIEPELLPPISL